MDIPGNSQLDGTGRLHTAGGWPERNSIPGFDVRIVDQHPILVIHWGVESSRSAGGGCPTLGLGGWVLGVRFFPWGLRRRVPQVRG